jgi:hypothetical protein
VKKMSNARAKGAMVIGCPEWIVTEAGNKPATSLVFSGVADQADTKTAEKLL